jgi:ABC-2 type transport system permease protein
MHAFSGLRWWPVAIMLAVTVGLLCAAYAVFARRDFGAGVLAARPGPARADGRLAHPSGLGLAWRLQRGAILGWTAGMTLMGLAYGSLGDSVGDVIGDSEAAREMMAGSAGDLVDGFYGTAMLMLALIASGFAVSSALRPRGEEDDGRVEALLATALRRRTWLGGHVLMTVGGTVLVLLGAGLGLGAGYALTTGKTEALATYSLGTLGYAAPVLVLAGVARLLVGTLPRAAALAWLVLGWCVVVLFFGRLLRLPEWAQDLSPFHHLALVPAEDFRWLPVVLVVAVAAVLSGAGQLAFMRRDVR